MINIMSLWHSNRQTMEKNEDLCIDNHLINDRVDITVWPNVTTQFSFKRKTDLSMKGKKIKP